jgi:lysophospholipase L1-like esterase
MRHNRIFLLFLLPILLFGCQSACAESKVENGGFFEEVSFLGDSITAHMPARAGIDKSRVWATKERYLNLDSRITYARILAPDTGEEERIAEVAARLQPRYLVVTLGIDYGVYYYRNDLATFEKYYEKLLDSIAESSPDTIIIPQSIFPVTKACVAITNEMIDNANTRIREIAARRSLPYLDTQSVLRDEEGYLRASYCYSEDGIHLSEQGYRSVLSYIEQFARNRGWCA